MNRKRIALSAMAGLLAFGLSASPKRGVSENSFAFASQMRALTPAVGWYYNWGNTPGTGYKNEVSSFEDMEYVPMCWNGNYNADKIREYAKSHPGCKYLLGFNEPNFTNQANMTPAQAAALWPAVQALAKELGLELVSPALNYSPNPPYQDPLKWMDEFVAIVGPDAFDYVAIHNYGGLGVMKDLAGKFHDRYGKPVWVTEFCNWPGGAGDVYVSPEGQISSMIETVEWLEQTEWIHRYAWFKAIGESNAPRKPNYGLLEKQVGAVESFLTEQGLVYCHIGDCDRSVFHPVNRRIASTEYVARTKAGLGRGSHPDCPKPIEVSSFSSGATLDYQFDVPEDGDYSLLLTVSGKGEPERFDPVIGLYEDCGDDADEICHVQPATYTLSGSDSEYAEISFPVTLTAGKHTLRIKDGNPFQQSGIRISMVELRGDASVEGIGADAEGAADVYDVTGICVRRNADKSNPLAGLPAGLYIVGGRKYIKR